MRDCSSSQTGRHLARQVGQLAKVDAAFLWAVEIAAAGGGQSEFAAELGVLGASDVLWAPVTTSTAWPPSWQNSVNRAYSSLAVKR
jgi:hypothetical protein